jgi:hypothetical protein
MVGTGDIIRPLAKVVNRQPQQGEFPAFTGGFVREDNLTFSYLTRFSEKIAREKFPIFSHCIGS